VPWKFKSNSIILEWKQDCQFDLIKAKTGEALTTENDLLSAKK